MWYGHTMAEHNQRLVASLRKEKKTERYVNWMIKLALKMCFYTKFAFLQTITKTNIFDCVLHLTCNKFGANKYFTSIVLTKSHAKLQN